MKIDLVYLWVDGSDKKWQAKKNAALAKNGRPLSGFATRDARWDDNDELRYSLRSAEKFAPWINHIYIVTDNQRPKWLRDSKRVTIVDHRDIIPKKYLPTFNSSMIELFLYNIPGLSEHFLFANDDFFFGAPVRSEFFFDKFGNPIVIVKQRHWNINRRENDAARGGMWFRTIRNSVRLVRRVFGLKYDLSMKHAIEPMRKSYLAENFEQFRDEFLLTTATRFREGTNIQRLVFPMLDNAKDRNTLVLNWRVGADRIIYDVRRDGRLYRVSRVMLWLVATVFGFIKYDLFDKNAQWIKFYRPALFCINDTGRESNFRAAQSLMDEMFPEKSGFEA